VLDLLAAMQERRGMTVIIASHDPSVTGRADRLVPLVDGHVGT
jgi:predicted ABC-type transport system involved in lysophospholipase L1 biosynthesis ATPase subunit